MHDGKDRVTAVEINFVAGGIGLVGAGNERFTLHVDDARAVRFGGLMHIERQGDTVLASVDDVFDAGARRFRLRAQSEVRSQARNQYAEVKGPGAWGYSWDYGVWCRLPRTQVGTLGLAGLAPGHSNLPGEPVDVATARVAGTLKLGHRSPTIICVRDPSRCCMPGVRRSGIERAEPTTPSGGPW
jgi:hypothetical protein